MLMLVSGENIVYFEETLSFRDLALFCVTVSFTFSLNMSIVDSSAFDEIDLWDSCDSKVKGLQLQKSGEGASVLLA